VTNLASIYKSSSVIWDGPTISCINLCKGDTVSDLIYKIGKQICCIIEQENDLKELDLECLINYCSNCNKNFTIKYILQLILDNDCDLKTMINNLEDQLQEKLTIVLDLDFSCIDEGFCEINQPFDNCGKLTTQDLNDILQYFIDKICCQKSQIEYYENSILSSEEQYNDDKESINIYTEPKFTTCLSSVQISHSLNTQLNASNVCQLISNVGTNIEDALDEQIIYTPMGIELDPATNLAQSTYNQWIVLGQLDFLLSFVESRICCQPKCSDVVISPYITYDNNIKILTIDFRAIFGNVIPTSWLDNGSIISVTDDNGLTISNYYSIVQELIVTIDVSSLDLTSTDLSIVLNTSFKNNKNNLICNKIYNYSYTLPVTPPEQQRTFAFPQIEPTNIWVINHNLGHNPDVITVDQVGNLISGTIDNLNTNLLTITFGSTYSGTAYLT